MFGNVDEPLVGRLPVTGVTVPIGYGHTLHMVGVGAKLGHDAHAAHNRTGVTLGAVARESEGRMTRHRLVLVTGIAGIVAGMTVREAVLVAGGADPGLIVRVGTIILIMFAVIR